jgi:hypothetical protein
MAFWGYPFPPAPPWWYTGVHSEFIQPILSLQFSDFGSVCVHQFSITETLAVDLNHTALKVAKDSR